MESLKSSGFDVDNPEHVLILLGDIFDRGREPYNVYKFIRSLPPERVILVKGNHEYLLLELVNRKMPFDHDFHNGTFQTLVDLYKNPWKEAKKWIKKHYFEYKDKDQLHIDANEYAKKLVEKLYNNKKINEIVKWINSSSWLNYFELGQYIFVHSFIPLKGETPKTYFHNWRDYADKQMWEQCVWGCPYELYLAGYFKEEEKNGKILVCGHWHTSDFYNKLLYQNDNFKQLDIRTSNPIFKSDKYPGLIGIDACTALTKKVNVLVIKESDLMELT